ncbi:MAG: hypothetical protein HYT41_02500 [Candidatus Sungbacteria bacterium]|nr:hypothetical protein [Candidatus Sungbacteria bacterium]
MKTTTSSEQASEGRSDGIRKNATPHVIRLTPKVAVAPARPVEDFSPEPAAESEFLGHWQERHAAAAAEDAVPDMPEDRDEEMTFSQPESVVNPARHGAPRTRTISSSARIAYIGAFCGIVAVAGAFGALTTVWARATIVVQPRVDEIILRDIAAVLDTSAAKVQIPRRIIPAEKLSFAKTVTREFVATGRDSGAARARGTVKITNSFSSSPQPLVAGTRLATSGGALYRLVKPVTVPGATTMQGKLVPQSIDAEAAADIPGEEGNMAGPLALTIPGFKGTPQYEGFSASAPHGFAGGSRGASSVITKDDLKRAEEETTKAAFDELKDEIGRTIPAGFSSPEALREITITKVTAPAAGTVIEKFTVTASAVGRALVFRPEDAEELIKSFALEDMDSQELVAGSANLSYHARTTDFAKGRADVVVNGTVQARAVISRDQLIALVAGKKQGSISDLLKSRPELKDYTLSLFPPWRSSVPGDTGKIRFVVE